MTKAWAGLFTIATLASVALLPGCNNASCTFTSKCQNDGPSDPVQQFNNSTLCNNRKNDPVCGGAYSDYVACFEANQTCTSSGVTDYTITDGMCGVQYANYTNCANGTDGGHGTDAAGE
jgi:hypothetical protein